MNVEFLVVVGEEAVGLVASVVLGAETPVNVRKDWLVLEVYSAEDTAAYSGFPSTATGRVENKGVYQLLVQFWLKSMMIFNRFVQKKNKEEKVRFFLSKPLMLKPG